MFPFSNNKTTQVMETKSKQSSAQKQTTENFIKDIRRKTRKLYSSEQKILIVMEALWG